MSGGVEGRRTRAASWSTRFAAVVTGVVAVSTLGSSPDAAADTCPIELIVPCDGSGTPPTATTTTTVPPTTTTAPRASRQPSPAAAAARLVVLLNAERDRAGLARFTVRGDVADIASAWSTSMARAGRLTHNDAYFTAETRRRLRAHRLGENVARNADVEAAHRALMASPGHRANILNRRFTVVGVGAQLRDGSWWLTENFLEPVSGSSGSERTRSSNQLQAGTKTVDHRPRATGTTPAGVDSGEVLAASGSESEPVEIPPTPRATTTTLAAEPVLDPRRIALLLVPGTLGLAFSIAVRRSTRRTTETADVDVTDAPGTSDASDAGDHLAEIVAWARTLDDRWAALSECDKRIATQIIRRRAEDALDARHQAVEAHALA